MKRIDSLEGLRGIAAFMVLFNHLGVMFYPAYYWEVEETGRHCEFIEYYLGQTPLAVLFAGHSGVMIFFILTGFGSFLACDKGREQCVRYASLRFFKLAVLLMLSTMIIGVLLEFNFTFYNDIVNYTCSPWIQGWGTVLEHNVVKFFFGNWFTTGSAYNPTLWTMPYIFMGSAICVMLYVLWCNLKKGYIASLCVGICLIIFGMPNYVACVLGYLLGYYYRQKPDRRINIVFGALALLMAVFLCGYPMETESQWIFYHFLPRQYVSYYHMAGAFLLLYISLFYNPVKKVLESKVFLALGNYSMSFYVIHFAILMSVTSYLFIKLLSRYSYNVSVLIVWVVTVFVTCVAAVLLKRVIDRIYVWLDWAYDRVYGYMNQD